MSLPLIGLASNSPRRREMLAWLGWEFSVQPASIDETPQPGELPPDYVVRLAEGKARRSAGEGAPARLILAADTTVADGGEILGKPENPQMAAAMLRQLRGRVHQVFTALALLDCERDLIISDLCRSDVPMRRYRDAEIDAYIASGDPFDKAGAYAIQHPQFHPVERFEGCYANVMGLPLCHLARTLDTMNLEIEINVPQICQARLEYRCPVYRDILNRVV